MEIATLAVLEMITMVPNLKPSGPLSQVVFVHDYIHLVFGEDRINVYNLAEVDSSGVSIRQGEAGFCDTLVALIGQRVTEVSGSDDYVLSLTFEHGTRFLILSGEADANGPEAFECNGPNNLVVVERNA